MLGYEEPSCLFPFIFFQEEGVESVEGSKLECALVALVLGTRWWLWLCQAMSNLWRKGRMVQERHLCSQSGQGEDGAESEENLLFPLRE